ncbi:MAG: tetratricopeptide repeat protein [Candidatus Limnocylindria bacterium]
MATRAGSAQSEKPKVSALLGERVRAARSQLGLSQAQLAGDELTKGFISQLESGLVRPSIRSLQLIAGRLGKPLDYFIGDEPLAANKRLAFHRVAAETAAEQDDWSEVRRHVGIALEQSPHPRERAGLLYLLARAEASESAFERVFEAVSESLGLVQESTDPPLVAGLLFLRGTAYLDLGQLGAATEAYEAARDVIERNEIVEPRLRSRVLISLGTAYRRLNRTSKAIAAYESALAIASRASELRLAARGFMGIAVTHYDAGELDTAISSYQRALELFRRVADLDFELNTLQSIATIQFESGDEAAKGSAKRAMDRALEVGSAHWAAVAEVILARIALREGQAAEALRMAKHAETVLRDAGDEIQRADALGAAGAAHEALGRTSDADRAYRRSIDLYTSIGDFADRSGMAAEYARVLRARGEVDKAFEMLELARGTAPRG